MQLSECTGVFVSAMDNIGKNDAAGEAPSAVAADNRQPTIDNRL
jgi:hypothetical protein